MDAKQKDAEKNVDSFNMALKRVVSISFEAHRLCCDTSSFLIGAKILESTPGEEPSKPRPATTGWIQSSAIELRGIASILEAIVVMLDKVQQEGVTLDGEERKNETSNREML